ncbi:MAG: hypothetical protein KGZ25_03290 [Planctomycetes bacterium]|nr:hypothetical protein [Planctomycetota bacterium]
MDHYDEEIGLFLCPQLYGEEFKGDPTDRRDRRRADGAGPFKKLAGKVYMLIGQVPPTPDEGTLGFETPQQLEQFFDQRHSEQNPYGFGSTIGDFFHKRTLWLRGQNRPIHEDPWIEWAYDYVEQVRDPRTGLMTGNLDDPALQMNGLFKLSCSSFWNHDRPIPRAKDVVDSVLQLLDPERGFGENCEDYNATLLLCRLSDQEDGYRKDEILDGITGPVMKRLEARRRPDGGFSMHVDHCLTRVNGYAICDPLPESDQCGTGQQLTILNELEALGQDRPGIGPLRDR